jgi:hypothetical protein
MMLHPASPPSSRFSSSSSFRWRDALFACFLVASCAEGDDQPTQSGLREGAERGPAGEAGAQGPKGDKGDKGDGVTASVKEVFGNRAGALPLTGALTTTGGRLLITASGSGYRTATAGTIGFDITIDGTPVGALNFFTNEAGSHRTVPARTLVIQDLIGGNHEIKISAQADTMTDGNDYFHLTVMELTK